MRDFGGSKWPGTGNLFFHLVRSAVKRSESHVLRITLWRHFCACPAEDGEAPGSRRGPASSRRAAGSGWHVCDLSPQGAHLTPAPFNAEAARVGGSVSPWGRGAGRGWPAGFDFGAVVSAEVTRWFPETPEKEAPTPPTLGLSLPGQKPRTKGARLAPGDIRSGIL